MYCVGASKVFGCTFRDADVVDFAFPICMNYEHMSDLHCARYAYFTSSAMTPIVN